MAAAYIRQHPSSLVKKTWLLVNKTCLLVRYANIVQTVKNCYKIKIGFRDFASRFSAVLLRL